MSAAIEPAGEDQPPAIPMVRMDSIPVRLAVEVGSASLSIAHMFDLKAGAIVVLDRQVDEPLDIRINGTLIARGEVVSADGKYGVRITELAEADAFPSGERRS